ncbi:MAG TPA: diacylglycerol kinase family protein [Actinomycetota bacterium]|jgi:diacylglycerol kinase (ATP)|nr:diacylglycerol kinase family protein [Actinomycetota bacterium]
MSTVISPFGALAVIVDPTAGEGRVAAEVGAVERALAHRGLEHRIQVAEVPGDVSRLATAALDEGYRYLAAVGDDGTVQDVVNGMFRDGRTIVDSPVLAVMAAGSGCDLVRSFGLPGDVDGASSHLMGENTYELDVMKITARGRNGSTEVRYAHNVAEVGLHASATARAAGFPRWMGNGRRFVGFWAAYAGTRRAVLDVVVDGRPQQHRAWSVIVGNGQFADGGLRLSPRSFPGDGVLDALLFTGPKSDAYRLLPRIFRHGDHVPDPGIKELRARVVLRIDGPRPLRVVADGSVLGTTPVTFQVVPRQILLKL